MHDFIVEQTAIADIFGDNGKFYYGLVSRWYKEIIVIF